MMEVAQVLSSSVVIGFGFVTCVGMIGRVIRWAISLMTHKNN